MRSKLFAPVASRLLALIGSTLAISICAAQVSVTTYHNDNNRSGLNSLETKLTQANVNKGSLGLLYSIPVDGYVYAQPLYLPSLAIPGKGTHNVLFVATEHNSVYAFDADGALGSLSQQPLWHVNLGPSVPSTDVKALDIKPEIGITGTPVLVAPAQGVAGATYTLYVVAKTKTLSSSGQPVYKHELHALDATTGAEKLGGPVVIQATVNGTGEGTDGTGHVPFNPLIQNQRSGLAYLPPPNPGERAHIYVAFASHGDEGPYHGWLFAFDANTLHQMAVLNTSPNAVSDSNGLAAGGIWQAGAAPAVDLYGVYLATGNGSFNPQNGSYGDSILRLDPFNLKVLDYFTPSDQLALDASDGDLGSGGVMLLDRSLGSSTARHLLVQAGKGATLYLVDQLKMGGYNSIDHVVQEISGQMGKEWGAPAYFNGQIYYGAQYSPLVSFPISNGAAPGSAVTSSTPESFAYPGPTPSVSANGVNDGILWAIQADQFHLGGPSYLHAYNADNLAVELYNSADTSDRDAMGAATKFAVPTVVNGRVYAGTGSEVDVFGLGAWGAAPSISPSSGGYANSVTAKVSDSASTTKIYYTTDGTVPTTASTLYSGAVTLKNSCVFRARAFVPGVGASAVTDANYVINGVVGNGTGLAGSYYGNVNLTAPVVATRLDPTIDFNWNGQSPIAGVAGIHWSAEWTGHIQAQDTQTYTISTTSDDGVRVWINGVKVIDDWTYHAATLDTATVSMTKGTKYAIKIDYFQGRGGSSLQLFWAAPGTTRQIVPMTQLYPN